MKKSKDELVLTIKSLQQQIEAAYLDFEKVCTLLKKIRTPNNRTTIDEITKYANDLYLKIADQIQKDISLLIEEEQNGNNL
jgi:hypothetical protein